MVELHRPDLDSLATVDELQIPGRPGVKTGND